MASRDFIMHELDDKNPARNRKGSMTITKFKVIADLMWTADGGLQQEGVWSNQPE